MFEGLPPESGTLLQLILERYGFFALLGLIVAVMYREPISKLVMCRPTRHPAEVACEGLGEALGLSNALLRQIASSIERIEGHAQEGRDQLQQISALQGRK